MEMLLAERSALLRLPEPAFPIDRLRRRFRIEIVVPFTCDAVARVPRLSPDQLAYFASFDQICAFLVTAGRATLRADLKHFFGFFDRIMNLESFVQIARERFFTINMFARLHRIDGNLSMPRIVSGNHDGIDVFALEQLPMVGVKIGILEFRLFPKVASFAVKIANGGHHGVILVCFFVNAVEMVLPDANPETDDGHCNAIVGAGYICRWRLVLAVNWRFEESRRSNGGCGGRSLFDKFAARKAGQFRGFCRFHKVNRLQFRYIYMTKPNPKEFGVNTAKPPEAARTQVAGRKKARQTFRPVERVAPVGLTIYSAAGSLPFL